GRATSESRMSVEALVISAIKNKISLEVEYQGQLRQICPYRLGWRIAAGSREKFKVVFVYQIGGYSRRGLEPDGSVANLRCWNLAAITLAVPIQESWRHPNAWMVGGFETNDEAIIESEL